MVASQNCSQLLGQHVNTDSHFPRGRHKNMDFDIWGLWIELLPRNHHVVTDTNENKFSCLKT